MTRRPSTSTSSTAKTGLWSDSRASQRQLYATHVTADPPASGGRTVPLVRRLFAFSRKLPVLPRVVSSPPFPPPLPPPAWNFLVAAMAAAAEAGSALRWRHMTRSVQAGQRFGSYASSPTITRYVGRKRSGASTAQAYADRAGDASAPGGAELSAAGDGSLKPSPVAALGTLQCLVSLAAGAEAGAEAAEVPVAQLVGSLCEAQRQMRELLEARKLCAGRAQHVRAFCEARLLPPAALRGALLEAVAGEPCAVLVLPVERVRSGQARLAVQLHFAVDARRTVDAEE